MLVTSSLHPLLLLLITSLSLTFVEGFFLDPSFSEMSLGSVKINPVSPLFLYQRLLD